MYLFQDHIFRLIYILDHIEVCLSNNLLLSMLVSSASCLMSGSNANVFECSGDADIEGSYFRQHTIAEYLFECTQKIDTTISA